MKAIPTAASTFRLLFLCLLFVILGHFSCNLLALAQDDGSSPSGNTVQSGDIAFEEEEANKDSYSVTQDRMIEYFDSFAKMIEQGASALTASPEIDENGLQYLNAVYLYCSVNRGTCPMVLDAILEADMINSKLSGTAACPNMTRFWKSWARTSMDERHTYLVKTGHIALKDNFNRSARPRYLRCVQTIQNELDKGGDKDKFYTSRYASEQLRENILLVPKLLKELKGKNINAFIATGSKTAEEPAPEKQKESKTTKGRK